MEILRDYLRGRPDDALLDELGDDAAEMAKLVPELRRRIPIRDDSARLPSEQERYRLLETVRRWLEGLAHQRAVLLLIEDLHWADSASCLLLRHLAPSLMSAPILVLATCKEENLQSLDRLSGALAEFGRLQLYRHMTLGGLAGAAFKEILSGMGSGEPPAELVEAIHEQTGGNPFFVTELVNHLDAEGKLFGPDGDWRQALSQGEWEIPESVRVVIQRRLSSLSEETRKVLTVAAAVGKEFSYEMLEAVGEVSSEELLDGLEEGIRMGVIEETEGAATRFRFTRQFTRQTLLYVGSENPPRG